MDVWSRGGSLVRETRCEGGVRGVGGCRGGTGCGKESFQSVWSLLRSARLPRRRRRISASGILRCSPFIALRIWWGVVVRGGNSELVGLELVIFVQLLTTLGKAAATVH